MIVAMSPESQPPEKHKIRTGIGRFFSSGTGYWSVPPLCSAPPPYELPDETQARIDEYVTSEGFRTDMERGAAVIRSVLSGPNFTQPAPTHTASSRE